MADKKFSLLEIEILSLSAKSEPQSRTYKNIEQEKKFDGIFVLLSSQYDLKACEVVESYKNLKEVEMLFDD